MKIVLRRRTEHDVSELHFGAAGGRGRKSVVALHDSVRREQQRHRPAYVGCLEGCSQRQHHLVVAIIVAGVVARDYDRRGAGAGSPRYDKRISL